MLAGTGRDDASRNRAARQMRAAWLSFARHGHPGSRWPAYDKQQHQTMVFGESSGATSDPAGLAGS
jgi:para-nitrobenzyl esterase